MKNYGDDTEPKNMPRLRSVMCPFGFLVSTKYV